LTIQHVNNRTEEKKVYLKINVKTKKIQNSWVAGYWPHTITALEYKDKMCQLQWYIQHCTLYAYLAY